MWRAPPVIVQCTASSRASRGPGYLNVLNINPELRLGCIMKKDVAGTYTTEWGWPVLASRKKSQMLFQHLNNPVYLSGHSTKTTEGSLHFSRAGTALLPSIWTKQLFQSPPGLFTCSRNTSLIDQQLGGQVPWNRLFFLFSIGPSAASCCSRNFLHRQGHHRSPGLRIRLWEGRESQICGHKNSPGGEYPSPKRTPFLVPFLGQHSHTVGLRRPTVPYDSAMLTLSFPSRKDEQPRSKDACSRPSGCVVVVFPNGYFVMTNCFPFCLRWTEAHYTNKFPCVHSLIYKENKKKQIAVLHKAYPNFIEFEITNK